MGGAGWDVEQSFPARRVRRAFVAGALALLLPIALFFGLCDAFHFTEPLWLDVLVLVGAALSCIVGGRAAGRTARSSRARVFADAERVRLVTAGGERRIGRAEIEEVGVRHAADEDQDVVTLRLGGDEIVELRFAADGSAAAFERALAAGRPEGATRIGLATPDQRARADQSALIVGSLLGAVVGVGVSAAAHIPTIALALPVVAPLLIIGGLLMQALLARTRPEVVVGSDGIRWKNATGIGERFVPLDEFVTTRVDKEHVTVNDVPMPVLSLKLVLEGTKPVVVATCPADQPAVASAFAERIKRAVRERRARVDPGDFDVLGRNGADVGAWLAALAKVGVADGSYRSAGLSLDRLRELVEDPATTTEHRLAAAAILARCGGPADKGRIRIAAEVVASPRLRIALDTMAEGEEDAAAIEAALREAHRG